MRFSGKLTTWQDERGFGFISPTQGGEEIFLHIKMFPRGGGRPEVGEVFTFEVAPGPHGKRRAVNVQRVGAAPPSLRARNGNGRVALHHRVSGLLALAGCLAVYWICQTVWGVPEPVALACLAILAMSVLTFVVFAVDKVAASAARRRVPEMALHLLSLVGGWPGALLAQRMLHHKRAKPAFVRVFHLATATHLATMMALAAWWLAAWRE